MTKKKSKKETKDVKNVKNVKNVKKADIPSLESILAEADSAFTGVVKRYYALGEALVKAITYYGAEGRRAFKVRFPLTDNALRNLELVGRGKLLPQFAMCSDKFVNGLVEMKDSMTWQYKLLGSSKNGMIRVLVDGKVVDRSFDDFVKAKEVDCILSILSESDVGLTPEELAEKLRKLNDTVRAKFPRKKRPDYDYFEKDGKVTVKFFKSIPYTADDLRKILARLEAAEKKANEAKGN